MPLRRIAEQRERLILGKADRYLDDDERVLRWARASQVDGRREGFAYITPRRFIVHWTGRQDGVPGDFRWEDITSWGVSSDPELGPTLAVETADEHCFVRLRVTTAAMADDVAAFLKEFAEHAPRPHEEVSAPGHLGSFEPTSAPEVTQQKMTVRDHTRRIAVTLAGVALIVGAIAIIPLPGPFSFVVTIAGLAILAREYDWARDALDWTKQRYNAVAGKIKARRQSA
ncbi:MAG: PGPGW domain-containing protein [Actinomycetota bacterium]|nr:PGPGW domain-containing protein [Actinomycetota bacterium]